MFSGNNRLILFPHRFSIQGLRDFVFYTNEQVAVEKKRKTLYKRQFSYKRIENKEFQDVS